MDADQMFSVLTQALPPAIQLWVFFLYGLSHKDKLSLVPFYSRDNCFITSVDVNFVLFPHCFQAHAQLSVTPKTPVL